VKRVILTTCSYFIALFILAAFVFVVTISVAGPHSSLLPEWMSKMVFLIGWVIIIILPVLVAKWIYLKLSRQKE
jgi:hypothetical protein